MTDTSLYECQLLEILLIESCLFGCLCSQFSSTWCHLLTCDYVIVEVLVDQTHSFLENNDNLQQTTVSNFAAFFQK